MKCSKCGVVTECTQYEAKFCKSCGAELTGGEEEKKEAGNKNSIGSNKWKKHKKILLLIGAVLCLFGLLSDWGTINTSSSSINWVRKGSITTYTDQYGYSVGRDDNTYLSPEASTSYSSTSIGGYEMLGGRFALMFIIIGIFSMFVKLKFSFPYWVNYLPFAAFIWLSLVGVQGIFHGISFGLIIYVIGLILIYKGFLQAGIWNPLAKRT